MAEKIAGILGGMGPEATVDLMRSIIRLTPALDDMDHIRCIVDNNPKVPSRIKAIIEGTGEDPGPAMADMGKRLEAWGAASLAIACNTAHHYFDAVQEAVSIPVIHLIDVVSRHVRMLYPDMESVGILASPAVFMTGLYRERLKALNLSEVRPDEGHQARLLSVIRDVKKGDTGTRVRDEYMAVCSHLRDRGAEVAIVACTELSALAMELPVPVVDAADVLAREIIRMAKETDSLGK